MIMRANALGTVNINDAFYDVLSEGGCIIDTSSISAYLPPRFIMPVHSYPLSRKDRNAFMKKMMARVNLIPRKNRSGLAYAISKHFVIWYAKTDAQRYAKKNCRVLCITPGNFETPMGDLEKEEAVSYLQFNSIKRLGDPDEIASLYVLLLDEHLGYLTGEDIICDGGCIGNGGSALRLALSHH